MVLRQDLCDRVAVLCRAGGEDRVLVLGEGGAACLLDAQRRSVVWRTHLQVSSM